MSELHQERISRLKTAGLRVTGPRLAILEALEVSRSHPTAEMVYEELSPRHPSMSLSTVYATFDVLLGAGLIRRVASHAGKLRVDGTTQDHDHAICRACGEVFDVARDVIDRPRVPEELPQDLKVVHLHLEYEVLCRTCSEKE